jgi:hypothetical protein
MTHTGEERLDEYLDEPSIPDLDDQKIYSFYLNDDEYRFFIHSPGLINLSVKCNQQVSLYLFDKIGDKRWEFCYWNPTEKFYHVLARSNRNTEFPPLEGWDTLGNNFIEALLMLKFDVS